MQLSVDRSEQHRTPSRELHRVKLSLRHVVSMDVEPLYCAEQIRVPEALPDILKQWTKEVIRQNPRDINEFSARCVLVCVCGRACMRACICAYVYVYVCCSVCVEASPACGLAFAYHRWLRWCADGSNNGPRSTALARSEPVVWLAGTDHTPRVHCLAPIACRLGATTTNTALGCLFVCVAPVCAFRRRDACVGWFASTRSMFSAPGIRRSMTCVTAPPASRQTGTTLGAAP